MNIKALGYVVIESTDPEQWIEYATLVLGMTIDSQADDNGNDILIKMDDYSWRIRIVKGQSNCFSIAGWELSDKNSFDSALAELDRHGVEFERGTLQECKRRKVKDFVSLKDPAGGTLELFYHMQLDYQRLQTTTGVQRFVTGFHGDMGLGHYVIPTNQFRSTLDFYTNILGFGRTDYMHFHFSQQCDDEGQGLHFLHVDNPRHHSLALFQDPNPPTSGCVHLMFEVDTLDEVGYFIDRCKQHNVDIVSSLGKHTNDEMVSVYAQCPGGFAIEYGYGGVQLDWNTYKPTESSVPSLWGHHWETSK
jgi:3,4-dihydroxy-9,10-secoandrosta-1,3,5(10)-triene-9,17-dione 4,5-dioxygenase